MLICYVTIKLLWQTCLQISSIVAYTELQQTHIKWLHWTHCASGLYSDWADIFDTPTKQEKTYLNPCSTPLHTVSRKNVAQPVNRSKTLGTGVSLNVSLVWQWLSLDWSGWVSRHRKQNIWLADRSVTSNHTMVAVQTPSIQTLVKYHVRNGYEGIVLYHR